MAQRAAGINRYMLGCKLVNGNQRQAAVLELIDTCWDVNVLFVLSESQQLLN